MPAPFSKIAVDGAKASGGLPGAKLSSLVPSLTGVGVGVGHAAGDVVLEGLRVPSQVLGTVLKAAATTGVDATYLCALADKESGWSHGARSRASSAAGLFQFLEGTWLRMVKTHGAAWGLREEADAIAIERAGARVADPRLRSRILSLRHDPWLSAVLAAEMAKRDQAIVGRSVGRALTGTDAYLAHFLGPAGAARLLTAAGGRRNTAAGILPASARANRSLFYVRSGRRIKALGIAEFYSRLDRMIGDRMKRYAAFAIPSTSAGN